MKGRRGRGGARRGGAAARNTWCALGTGSANVHSSDGRWGGPTPPPSLHALPFALKSQHWGWGWGEIELSRSSSLRLLIFTSRPLCSYFGRDESYKGSVGIQGRLHALAALPWISPPDQEVERRWGPGGESHKAVKSLCVDIYWSCFFQGAGERMSTLIDFNHILSLPFSPFGGLPHFLRVTSVVGVRVSTHFQDQGSSPSTHMAPHNCL